MALAKTEIIGLYGRRARRYDFTANLYYLIGFREQAFRKAAVDGLNLRPGDTVVEIGCGTGLNFGLLQRAVGPQGRIAGVDMTPTMLNQADKRVARNEWSNVELIRSDAVEFRFPTRVDAVISTFALTLMPEYDRIIENAAAALSPGGRMAVLDFKEPRWPRWLTLLGVAITPPFGVTRDLMDRKPWESMERWFPTTRMRELYWGSTYLCIGESSHVGRRNEHATQESQS